MTGTSTRVQARAPGKLILSGEHAVVHGRPALVTAVDRFAACSARARDDRMVVFALRDLGVERSVPLPELRSISEALAARYEQFLAGRLPIADVAREPGDLFLFALHLLLERFFITPKHGWTFEMASTIPPGCGMGSSAATATSLLRAAASLVGAPMDADRLYEYSLEAEKLQHGKPSGVDPYISAHGGCVRFRQGQAEATRRVPLAELHVVDTGIPESTTGECVMDVSRRLSRSWIWDEFEAVTLEMDGALSSGGVESLPELIRKNHRLLVRIGVVPARVQSFIERLEADGSAAKICGAGAIRGEAAGVVLVVGSEPDEKLCRAAGYRRHTLRPAAEGAHLVP